MKKALVLLLALLPIWVYGQTDVQLSQQLFSRVNYNPAATGASNYVNVFLLARQQWIGFTDAPRTQVLNAHNYFESIKSGVGLSINNDKLGLINAINAKLSYAYHIHFNENSYLSLGLSGGILYKKFDWANAIPEQANDPTLDSYRDKQSEINPDFDFGIEFNTKNFQLGVSTTHLNNVAKSISDLKLFQANRHIYIYTKYIFDAGRQWKLVPTLMGVNNENTFSFEVNGMAYYRERFWFGASYRLNEKAESESVIGMVGLFITDFLRLGYSYDFNVGALKKYSSGSHEIMLSLRLSKGDNNYGRKSPRFFE
ncbi:MAG: type IX secretion system membrane protein PorP/SprF [Prevotellaceae bacterium]|jgi:type IX secretion system PorP/SprF family membrane protein|nr:type IX secretion system membrane protein PorP/SprF [Prevotellaceae bacterium]